MTVDDGAHSEASVSSSATLNDAQEPFTASRTVLVVGAAYGGHRATQLLITSLPSNWRVVVLERNTHFNHLYAFPRVSVVEGHEQKVFIPYTRIFEPLPHVGTVKTQHNRFLHGSLVSLKSHMHPDASSTSSKGKQRGRGVAYYVAYGGDSSGDDTDDAPLSSIEFDFLLYAAGSHLPSPINVWSSTSDQDQQVTRADPISLSSSISSLSLSTPSLPPQPSRNSEVASRRQRGSKVRGMQWLRDGQRRIRDAESVLVVGGGALGVQFASDIAYLYGTPTSPARYTEPQDGSAASPASEPRKPKRVTLLSSRKLLPRFKPWMHEQACLALDDLGVEVLTDTRADLSSLNVKRAGGAANGQADVKRIVRTLDGREIEADLVLLCTGQRPNTDHLRFMVKDGDRLINPASGAAYVTPHLQLAYDDRSIRPELQHIFVVGDAADAFGALNAGHTAYAQGEVAARNIAKLAVRQEEGESERKRIDGNDSPAPVEASETPSEPLEEYVAESHKIKVSVGFERAINENTGNHRFIEGGKLDLNTPNMWRSRGLDTSDLFV